MNKPQGTGYMAGPMTGRREWNYPEFHTAAKALRARGFSIHNPAEHYGGDTTLTRDLYLRAAIVAVLASDFVVVLPDWDYSPGANLEVDIALELGLPIFTYQPTSGRLVPTDVEPREPRRKASKFTAKWAYPFPDPFGGMF